MRTIQKTLFYMSSFMPLYILLIVQNIQFKDKNGQFSIKIFLNQFHINNQPEVYFWYGLAFLFVLSLFGCLLFFGVYTKKNGRTGKIVDAEFIREDTMGYIVTYIVPLISMNISSSRSLFINLMLFIIIGTFYVKNDQIFMNPLYNLFGYNIFSTEKGIYITKISKQKLKLIAKQGSDVIKINILADIYVIKDIS